jgi:hypothetical protein
MTPTQALLGTVLALAMAWGEPGAQVRAVGPSEALQAPPGTSGVAPPPLDWTAIRAKAGKRYPSRWDDLALLDHCDWLTTGELETGLGLRVPVTVRKAQAGCEHHIQLQGGPSEMALRLYVEVHRQPADAREMEAGFREGVPASQFTRFDAGVPDLNVYVSIRGEYLYVFPANGITLWRLGYMKDAPARSAFYTRASDGSADDLGRRFMRTLVAKYKNQL